MMQNIFRYLNMMYLKICIACSERTTVISLELMPLSLCVCVLYMLTCCPFKQLRFKLLSHCAVAAYRLPLTTSDKSLMTPLCQIGIITLDVLVKTMVLVALRCFVFSGELRDFISHCFRWFDFWWKGFKVFLCKGAF